MNRSWNNTRSHKKSKISGYRRLMKTNKGRKIIRAKRKKGRRVI